MYPSSNASHYSACQNIDIDSLKPRILMSHRVSKMPWNREFMRFLARGIETGAKIKEPLLHETDWSGRTQSIVEQRLECYRSLIITPEWFDIDRPGHDSLLQMAGIERALNCDRKPHIVILSRQYGPDNQDRKMLTAPWKSCNQSLPKSQTRAWSGCIDLDT